MNGSAPNLSLWRRHAWIAYLAVFVGVCGHASSEFVAVLSGVGGPELSVWRFILGGLGLVGLALLFKDSRDLIAPFRTHALHLVILSALGVTVGYLLFHWSLDFATVPQVATAVTTIPIFVGLANLWRNREPIGVAKMVTGTAAVIGVALLVTDGYLFDLAGGADSLFGVLLAFACAAAVGTYTVLVRPIIAEYGALRITAITMMLGGIGLWLLVGVSWDLWVGPGRLTALDAGALAALLVIAFYNTTITQFLWIGGLAAVPDITRGSYLFFLKPVIATLLAVTFLAQSVTTAQMLAIFVICASVVVEANWKRLAKIFSRTNIV
ncbi:MAG: EamA family transporter [Rhodospirillales bacterium]|nr:EamA family transporter [Rhodospirillales bacterium]